MEVYIKGGHSYDCYDCYDSYIVLYSAIIAVYSKGVFADVVWVVLRVCFWLLAHCCAVVLVEEWGVCENQGW